MLNIVRAYLDAGLKMINISDTAGHAVPGQVEELYGALHALDPSVECACHFHIEPLMAVASEASQFFKRSLPGTVYRTGLIKTPTPQA